MPRDDVQVAGQMLDVLTRLRRVVGGRSRERLVGDEIRYLAALHLLQILGEAANRTSPAFRAAHPDIPWTGIIGMRNRIVHGYDDVSDLLVWNAALEGVEQLLPALARIVPPPSSGDAA